MPSGKPECTGLIERIGLPGANITHKIYTGTDEKMVQVSPGIADHEDGLLEAVKLLTDAETGVIRNLDEIEAVGHRIVHGGEKFTAPVIIDAEVKDEIERLFPLAPLHNPPSFTGIQVAEKLFKKARHIAVFDTSFHQTLPPEAYRYAIPAKFYEDNGIRVYGFHGISHKYVSHKAIEYLGKPSAKIITIHLGNGCSMAAVNAGTCVDTSMGLTPLDGLVMGTRSGNIDPSVPVFLMKRLGYSVEQVNELLNKQSGMLGLARHSDMRDIRKLIDEGDADAALAFGMFSYRIKKFIGAYAAAMGGLDAIVFTAGIGENDPATREAVCAGLDFMGLKLDIEKNLIRNGSIREINTHDSPLKILVAPTNEELEIANQCFTLLSED